MTNTNSITLKTSSSGACETTHEEVACLGMVRRVDYETVEVAYECRVCGASWTEEERAALILEK